MKKTFSVVAASCLLAMVGACSSENPAGGSHSLTAPKPVSPAMGAQVSYNEQPLTLAAQNAVTTGTKPLTYTFEVASDSGFTAIVAKKENVVAGTDVTSTKLDAALAGAKGYYWRVRANDGTSAGPNSEVINFSVGSTVNLEAPQPETPVPNGTVGGVRPTFVINNAGRSGPVGQVYYRFEIAENNTFSPVLTAGTVLEASGGQTSWTVEVDLPTGKTLYWHVRSADPSNSVSSSFSNTRFGSKLGGSIPAPTNTSRPPRRN